MVAGQSAMCIVRFEKTALIFMGNEASLLAQYHSVLQNKHTHNLRTFVAQERSKQA